MQHHATRISIIFCLIVAIISVAACSNGPTSPLLPSGASILQRAEDSQMDSAIFSMKWNNSISTATGTGQLSASPEVATIAMIITNHGNAQHEEVVTTGSSVYIRAHPTDKWTQGTSDTTIINPVTQSIDIIPYDDFQDVKNVGQEGHDGLNTWHLQAKIQVSDPSAQDSNVQIDGLADLWVNVSNYFPVDFAETVSGKDSGGKDILLSVDYQLTQWNIPVSIATPDPTDVISG